MRRADTDVVKQLILVMGRVCAFLILDCAQCSDRGTVENAVRCMKVALKAARNCLDMKQLDLAVKVLEKAASYAECFSSGGGNAAGQQSTDIENPLPLARLVSEYYILRTVLVCITLLSIHQSAYASEGWTAGQMGCS